MPDDKEGHVMYTITDDMLGRPIVTPEDKATFPNWTRYYPEYSSVLPMFGSAGAMFAMMWTLDGGADRECGRADMGNGWSALFEADRLILRGDDAGYRWAYRIADDADMETVWAELEAGAVTDEPAGS